MLVVRLRETHVGERCCQRIVNGSPEGGESCGEFHVMRSVSQFDRQRTLTFRAPDHRRRHAGVTWLDAHDQAVRSRARNAIRNTGPDVAVQVGPEEVQADAARSFSALCRFRPRARRLASCQLRAISSRDVCGVYGR